MRNRSRKVISASIIALFATAAAAQDHGPQAGSLPPIDQVEVAQLHLAALAAATATGPVEVITAGSTKILEAVILEVRGRCQWREHEESRWQKAATDHRLKPGAMIRTGLKSHMALRCGPNATILVDSNSRVTVPALAQNGDTLSTIVQVERGRADFKVDRVGLTNDFSVVTPSGALSVRGTGMGVSYDGFNGASIFGARFNSINAIEMRYYGNKKIWSVSGGGSTSTKAKNPTMKAVAKAVGGRKPLNKSNAMDAKASASKGGPPQNGVGGGIRETTRLVLGAEQGLRASERREEFEKPRRLEIEAEQLAALQEPEIPFTPPAEPPPANDEPPPPPPEQPPPPQDDPPVPPVDPPDEPPAVPIIDIPGYQQYFREVVSPTDRGMLAAAIYLDLAPATTTNPIILENIDVDGGYLFRHRIPASLEPAVHDLMTKQGLDPEALGVRLTTSGKNFNYGADLPPGIYDPNNPITNIGDMYAHIIHHGELRHFNGWANGTGAPGPMDHDLDVILTTVNQFASIPQLQPYGLQIREKFSDAVKNEIYPGTVNGGFNNYGQSLLNSHMSEFWQPPQP